jgi:hypothetical protein
MGAFVNAHPWLTFFIALAAIGAVREILSPPKVVSVTPPTPTPGTLTGALGRFLPPVPAGNSVFHGLVRHG